MTTYIATVIKRQPYVRRADRLPLDDRGKATGDCPLDGSECTDVYGRHHSMLVEAYSPAHVVEFFEARGMHVTRVEYAVSPLELA